jgi:hypothetical protein
MERSDLLDVLFKRFHDCLWPYGNAIFLALSIPDHNPGVAKIHILDTQADALHQAKACPVQ